MDFKDNYTLNNGILIPNIGFGTWRSPNNEETINAVSTALKCGYRLIDTASAYNNENEVGQGLLVSGLSRDKYFLTTKLPNPIRGYEETLKEVYAQLKRLKTDYIDLYLIHWPRPRLFHDDYIRKNAESYLALEELYHKGIIKALGVSNFLPHHLDELMSTTHVLPSVNQILLYPGQNHTAIKEYCSKKGIQLEAYTPLGKPSLLNDPTINRIADNHHKAASQVLLNYQISKGIIPLVKSVHEERILSNIDCFDFELTPEETYILDNFKNQGVEQTDEMIDNINH